MTMIDENPTAVLVDETVAPSTEAVLLNPYPSNAKSQPALKLPCPLNPHGLGVQQFVLYVALQTLHAVPEVPLVVPVDDTL